MDWMNKLPLKQKIVTGCYLVAALFAVPVLITLILMDRLLVGIILVAVLAALTYRSRASLRERLHLHLRISPM